MTAWDDLTPDQQAYVQGLTLGPGRMERLQLDEAAAYTEEEWFELTPAHKKVESTLQRLGITYTRKT